MQSCCCYLSSVAVSSCKSRTIVSKIDDEKQKQKQQQQVNNNKNLILAAAAGGLLALSPIYMTHPPVAQATSSNVDVVVERGSALFGRACIGCHDAGGNIIQPGATLFLKDLLRNGVDTEEEIYRVTYSGKGRMPGFGETCMPRGQCTFGARLKDEEIKVLAEFVKLQADQGWRPNVEFYNRD